MHVGETTIHAVPAESEALMIDPKLMQDGGMNVIALGRIGAIERLVAPLIALPPLPREGSGSQGTFTSMLSIESPLKTSGLLSLTKLNSIMMLSPIASASTGMV